jgi:hypothetical protein
MKSYTKKEIGELGTIRYYNDRSELHKTDGPAIEWADEAIERWRTNNLYHLIVGSATDYWFKGKDWYLFGKIYNKSEHNRMVLFSNLEPQRVNFFPEESD